MAARTATGPCPGEVETEMPGMPFSASARTKPFSASPPTGIFGCPAAASALVTPRQPCWQTTASKWPWTASASETTFCTVPVSQLPTTSTTLMSGYFSITWRKPRWRSRSVELPAMPRTSSTTPFFTGIWSITAWVLMAPSNSIQSGVMRSTSGLSTGLSNETSTVPALRARLMTASKAFGLTAMKATASKPAWMKLSMAAIWAATSGPVLTIFSSAMSLAFSGRDAHALTDWIICMRQGIPVWPLATAIRYGPLRGSNFMTAEEPTAGL